MRRLSQIIVLMAFTLSSGGHYAVLQSIAWGCMIQDYAHFVPMAQAVQLTFSGKAPCPICKAIAEKRESERQKSFSPEKFTKKLCPDPVQIVLTLPRIESLVFLAPQPLLLSRSDAPPTPPPRLA